MARRPAPNLLAAVGNRQKGQRLVAEALRDNAWIRDITGALSVLVIIQYLHLRERGDAIVLQLGVDDRVIWKCSSSGRYSARSAYAALTMGQTDLFGAKEAWKVRAPHEHKFFYLVSLAGRASDATAGVSATTIHAHSATRTRRLSTTCWLPVCSAGRSGSRLSVAVAVRCLPHLMTLPLRLGGCAHASLFPSRGMLRSTR
jgi:hypothetical protein